MPLPSSGAGNFFAQYYYTKIELNAGQLNTLYFTESEFLATSAGAGDAGKPVKLNSSGLVDATMMVGGSVATHAALTAAHGATGAVVGTTNTQTLTNKTLTAPVIGAAEFSNMNHTHAGTTTGGTIAHTALTSIGTNTHAQIDTAVSASTAHIAATTGHGATGAVVGTTNTQTLTNKTLTNPILSGSSNVEAVQINAAGGQNFSIIGGNGVGTGIAWRATAIGSNFTLPADNIPQVAGVAGYARGYVIGFPSEDSTDVGLTFWAGSSIGADMTKRMSLSVAGVLNVDNSITVNGVAVPTISSTSTLSNKTLDTPIIATISNSGTITLPTGTRTLVARDTTDTLTNKTLDSPIITTQAIAPLIYGSTAANGDIVINGTSSATKTSSYVTLQSTGGNVGIGTSSPGYLLTALSSTFYLGLSPNEAGSGKNYLISGDGAGTGPLRFLATSVGFDTDKINILNAKSPASSSTGTTGDIAWDTGFLYVCTTTDTWKRVALTGGY